MHVLVSGAGIAGLTLAYCLQRAGIECTVLEREPGPRSEGHMMDFFGSGYDAAERLELLPDLERIRYPIARLVYLNEDGGEKFSVAYPVFRKLFDNRHFHLTRGDLEHVLYEKVRDRIAIRFGVTVESFEQESEGVNVALSDGSRFRAGLLVGADGAHSRVRHLAFGRESSFTRYLGYNAAAFVLRDPAPSAQVSGVIRTLAVPGRQVSLYPVRGGDIAAVFVCAADEPIDSGIGCPEQPEIYLDSVSQIEIPHWSAGRVVLAGDAACRVSILSGQGASLAMAGAYILAEELSVAGDDPRPALERYERRLRPGVEKIQRAGRSMADWLVPRTRIRLAIRDAITRFAGSGAASWLVKRAIAPESVFRLP